MLTKETRNQNQKACLKMKESKRLPGIEIYNHLKLGNFVQFEYEEERFPGEVPQLDPKKKRIKIKAMAMAGVKR